MAHVIMEAGGPLTCHLQAGQPGFSKSTCSKDGGLGTGDGGLGTGDVDTGSCGVSTYVLILGTRSPSGKGVRRWLSA